MTINLKIDAKHKVFWSFQISQRRKRFLASKICKHDDLDKLHEPILRTLSTPVSSVPIKIVLGSHYEISRSTCVVLMNYSLLFLKHISSFVNRKE